MPVEENPKSGGRVHVVVAGHVDHGKSTIVGRLLADTDSLPAGKLEQIRALCARTARPFEYAFVLDALRNERAQGVTIDAARVFFRSRRRDYVFFDAPGHLDFLKNMLTGASHSSAALLVIDCSTGLSENSRRHGYLLSLLGIRNVVVVVNKMDLVNYEQRAYRDVAETCRGFLASVGIAVSNFVPVCGRHGDNIARPSVSMPWYSGSTVVDLLDEFPAERAAVEGPFRMHVQGVYKFAEHQDQRRIVAGRIASGRVSNGDELQFFPSGKRSRVRRLETDGTTTIESRAAGDACGFTLVDDVYIERGETAARVGERAPTVADGILASIIWLGAVPLTVGDSCVLKHGTTRVRARVEAVRRVIDMQTLAGNEDAGFVGRNEVAECALRLETPFAFDPPIELAQSGRFVLVRGYDIEGGGVIRAALPAVSSTIQGSTSLLSQEGGVHDHTAW